MFTATIKQVRLHHRPCLYLSSLRNLVTAPTRKATITKRTVQRIAERSHCDFEPKSDAWYSHHFSVSTHYAPKKRRKPLYPLVRLRPDSVQGQIPQSLRDPLEFASLERADDDIINDCLELYIAKVKSQTRDLDKARVMCLEDRPGAKALSALSRLGCSERTLSPNSTRLYRNIAHCLIAENNKEAIWQLARDDSPSGAHATSTFAAFFKLELWKQILIRSTFDAQIHWTSSRDFTADALVMIVQRDDIFDLWDKRSALQRLVHPALFK
jgi:hypothetical protein